MAFLSYATHALAENRHRPLFDLHTHTAAATGTVEREAALLHVKSSVKPASGSRKPTVAADRGYDTAEFVGALTAQGLHPTWPAANPTPGFFSVDSFQQSWKPKVTTHFPTRC